MISYSELITESSQSLIAAKLTYKFGSQDIPQCLLSLMIPKSIFPLNNGDPAQKLQAPVDFVGAAAHIGLPTASHSDVGTASPLER